MLYEEFQLKVLRLLRRMWDRVISFDVETYVKDLKFLTNERILATSFARRTKRVSAMKKELKSKHYFSREILTILR